MDNASRSSNLINEASKRKRIVYRLQKIAQAFKLKRRSRQGETQSTGTTGTIPSGPAAAAIKPPTLPLIPLTIRRDSFFNPKHPAEIFKHLGKSAPPPRCTLMGLPRELRDMIYDYLFDGNGLSYIKNQLMGFPLSDLSTYSKRFSLLLTCKQIYAESFPTAYRLSCFYWFKSYSSNTLDLLCQRMNMHQCKQIRHIAFWSNPYLYEDFLDKIPSSLRLREVTVCSNYMSGPIPQSTIQGRMVWVLRNIRRMESLKRFQLLTGCGIAPGRQRLSDCGFAKGVRAAFEARRLNTIPARLSGVDGGGDEDDEDERKVEVSQFEKGTHLAVVSISPLPGDVAGKLREVQLRVASVYEGILGPLQPDQTPNLM